MNLISGKRPDVNPERWGPWNRNLRRHELAIRFNVEGGVNAIVDAMTCQTPHLLLPKTQQQIDLLFLPRVLV